MILTELKEIKHAAEYMPMITINLTLYRSMTPDRVYN